MSRVTVTSMAYCDVATIAHRCQEPRTIVACHILEKNLNRNNCDTSAEYARSGLKIPDFSHIVPVFCMQSQKTAEADAKCVNWDRWIIGLWFQSQLKLRVVKSKDSSMEDKGL